MGGVAGGPGGRLFISVAGPDRPWARWVTDRLGRSGFVVEYDEWDWPAGSSFIGRMDAALAAADRMVAIVSPHYFDPATYGRAEREAALTRAQQRDGFLVPVLVAACEPSPLLARLSHVDLVGCDEREAERRLVTGLHGPRRPGSADQIPWPGPVSADADGGGGGGGGGGVPSSKSAAAGPPPFPGRGSDAGPREAVTVLHLPGLRVGREDSAVDVEELPALIAADVAAAGSGWVPDLVVVTGDVAERGRRREYERAVDVFDELLGSWGLSRSRLALVPGRRDVNAAACQSHFAMCEDDEVAPEPPYSPKWRHFALMVESFYGESPAATAGGVFAVGQEWSLFQVDELKLVVAGINSTMALTHRPQDDAGQIGAAQADWFAERLAAYERRGWLRLGAIHHGYDSLPATDGHRPAAGGPPATGRHSDLFGRLNLLLTGQQTSPDGTRLDNALVLGPPRTAEADPAHPMDPETDRAYELLRIDRTGITQRPRVWTPDQARWIAGAGAGAGVPVGATAAPRDRISHEWTGVDAALPPDDADEPDAHERDRDGREPPAGNPRPGAPSRSRGNGSSTGSPKSPASCTPPTSARPPSPRSPPRAAAPAICG
ncbi:toll/interleukin-1 receptor domain-containing protein [Frankia tisae]|uniref:toll/interleukin-1 receptor domain-containing protein n=1 Tax=Frankia tisae TaxID=2950104 RepID=UPI0021C092D1|nr:toll/interleukin-1 receptor domain-containing protein [Frankia tisae]